MWSNWANDWAELWVLMYKVHLIVCYYHVTYAFESQSTRYSWKKVKELLARNRQNLLRLNVCNWIWTHNHLFWKGTLNHFFKLTKSLSWVVITYLHGAFDCMFLSCHVRISEWIHTLYFPECPGSPCSKQAWFPKVMWLQLDSNLPPPSS